MHGTLLHRDFHSPALGERRGYVVYLPQAHVSGRRFPTLYLLHGKDDAVVPYRHTVEAAHRLLELGGDVTADVHPFVGHEIPEETMGVVLQRLTTHVPRRMWEEAMRAADEPEDGKDA